ncbi:MAG: formate dehydrogenase subunit gamma [Rhodospirillaceae bacterium]|jgi:formate dehydrogenase subunit gamma|nr:formate dehydrogenase subunit gamma [Rhodospirillaceae bacterium]|tara:strand:- start:3278 stop:4381 length:1104 start_codon:yes stop_codon:yes gene_type:complete
MTWSNIRYILGALALAFAVAYGAAAGLTGSPTLEQSAKAQMQGFVPGGAKDNAPLPWGPIRKGLEGKSNVKGPMANKLVQSQGEEWRNFKNGPLSQFGGWLLLAILVVLVLYRVLRGRIDIDAGPSGRTIERFNALERATHWLTASSFIVLALTGLNVMYGRYFLLPVIGPDAFAALTYYGKLTHIYIAFAFMVGVVIMFVLLVRHNIIDATDFNWIAKGGGLFSKGVHPPAKRFNFGQKCIFWIVVLGGLVLSVSGVALLFPFEITPWADTFAFMNIFGFGLPTDLTPLQETQLSVLGHGVAALIMIAIIIAHIYIGTPVGMEGAIGAVASGQVDVNWAKEHHSLWAAEMEGEAPPQPQTGEQPAE